MKPSGISKNTIIIVVVVALIALAYFYFEGGSAPTTSGIESSNASIGQSELQLLNQVENLNIDTNFFTDKAYSSLIDYTVEIPREGVGRPNPFAPVPGVPNPQAESKTVQRWIKEHDHGRPDRRKELWAFLMFQKWYGRWGQA